MFVAKTFEIYREGNRIKSRAWSPPVTDYAEVATYEQSDVIAAVRNTDERFGAAPELVRFLKEPPPIESLSAGAAFDFAVEMIRISSHNINNFRDDNISESCDLALISNEEGMKFYNAAE